MKACLTIFATTALFGLAACGADDGGVDESETEVAETETDREMDAGTDNDPWVNPEAEQRAADLASEFGTDEERLAAREDSMSRMEGLRIVVDQSDREVRIFRGDEQLAVHPVAVGTDENPTPIGEFAFHRVDLNPRWVPPNSDWAEDREPKEPGAPDNPMGRARLVYQMPYTIHGTDNLDSLGKAVSHGSIRLANENVIDLAEMMLQGGGAWEGEQWFTRMTENRDEEYQVPLEQNIPLVIQE